MDDLGDKSAPLVSVIVRTAGQPQPFARTLRSVFRQTHGRLQIIVADTGRHADQVIDGLTDRGDGREVVPIRLDPYGGRAAATNAALQRADGTYVAYIDEGDLFYPRHVEHLVAALEHQCDCGAAYADHYRTYRRPEPGGEGCVLGKVLSPNAGFDRLWLCRRDTIPLTSLIHRRDLLDRTGPCNENVKHLVDWDLARRLAFYTGFLHVPKLTAERTVPVHDGGRITDASRRHANECLRDQLLIRMQRPDKPWPAMPDVSVIFTPHVADDRALRRLRQIWRWTFAPYQVLLPLPPYELKAVKTEMPNLVRVPVRADRDPARRIDQVWAVCEGDYVAIVPPELPIADGWLETALHVLTRRPDGGEGIFLDRAGRDCWAALLARADLLHARWSFPELSVPASLAKVGVGVREPRTREVPFRYGALVRQAEELRRIGDGLRAARLLEQLQREHPQDLSLRLRTASALYMTERHDEQALELCRQINHLQPTVDSLVLEAKLHRRADRLGTAVELLEQSRKILNWKG
jgi:hypothetical protein